MHTHSASCGCDGPRGWPSNLARVRVAVAGVQPLVRGVIGALDAAWSNGLAGRTGTVIAGDGADPAYGYRGYVAYRSTAALPVGASATMLRSPFQALPSTSPADVRYLSDPGQRVMDHLRTLTPAGAR